MLPSRVAFEVEKGIQSWIRAAFPIKTPEFQHLFDDWFLRRENQFKGPWVSLDLPFVTEDPLPQQLELGINFRPYAHQKQGWISFCSRLAISISSAPSAALPSTGLI